MEEEGVVLYDDCGFKVEPKADDRVSWLWQPVALVAIVLMPGVVMVTRQEMKEHIPVPVCVGGTLTYGAPSTYTFVGGNTAEETPNEKKPDRPWDHRPHLAAPKNAPPSRVKVGPIFYAVHYTSAAALASINAWAMTDTEKREIWLDPKRTSNLRWDFLHELLHCAQDEGTRSNHMYAAFGGEEGFVETVDVGLLGILRDNPEVVAWLTKTE